MIRPSGKYIRKRRKPPRSRFRHGFFFFALMAALVLFAIFPDWKIPVSHDPYPVGALEIPRVSAPEFVIVCPEGRYTLLYDTLYRQPAWVAYTLTRGDVENRNATRRNRFTVCPAVQARRWPAAEEKDYRGSGYDRGHLVPSADRLGNQVENDATFRMSNIAPQANRLNLEPWNHLEIEIRRMAQRFDTLWIATGGVLKPGLRRIGRNGIGVPEHFYKVVLARRNGRYQSIGFLLPNSAEVSRSFWGYAVPVDSVRNITGIDFYPHLQVGPENRIGAECRPQDWK